jgi:hypothetical protein
MFAATFSTTNPTWTALVLNRRPSGENTANNQHNEQNEVMNTVLMKTVGSETRKNIA